MEGWHPPQGQGQTPPRPRLQTPVPLQAEGGALADSWPGGWDRGSPSVRLCLGAPPGMGWGWREGASATHRQAEMLPIVAVQFMVPLFQSRVNHQLVTSPMVVPPLARRAGLRRGLLVVVVGVTVLHAVNPT